MCIVFVIFNNTHGNLVTELYAYVLSAVHIAVAFSIIWCKIYEALLIVKALDDTDDTAFNFNPSYRANSEEIIIQLNKYFIAIQLQTR